MHNQTNSFLLSRKGTAFLLAVPRQSKLYYIYISLYIMSYLKTNTPKYGFKQHFNSKFYTMSLAQSITEHCTCIFFFPLLGHWNWTIAERDEIGQVKEIWPYSLKTLKNNKPDQETENTFFLCFWIARYNFNQLKGYYHFEFTSLIH